MSKEQAGNDETNDTDPGETITGPSYYACGTRANPRTAARENTAQGGN
jgi:hypothetical protein